MYCTYTICRYTFCDWISWIGHFRELTFNFRFNLVNLYIISRLWLLSLGKMQWKALPLTVFGHRITGLYFSRKRVVGAPRRGKVVVSFALCSLCLSQWEWGGTTGQPEAGGVTATGTLQTNLPSDHDHASSEVVWGFNSNWGASRGGGAVQTQIFTKIVIGPLNCEDLVGLIQ